MIASVVCLYHAGFGVDMAVLDRIFWVLVAFWWLAMFGLATWRTQKRKEEERETRVVSRTATYLDESKPFDMVDWNEVKNRRPGGGDN